MALTIAAVDAIRSRLAAVPRKDESAREVTRIEALERMRSEIVALREGGYSWEEVAELVSREGCRVTAGTLRTELSRGAGASRRKKRTARRVGQDERSAKQPAETVVSAKPTNAAAPTKRQPTRTPSVTDAPTGSFAVREDTDI